MQLIFNIWFICVDIRPLFTSFGTKRPWVRVPSPRPIKEAVAANAAAASFIFMSCFIVDISLKEIPQVKRERLRFIIELMRAGFTEGTKVNMISATGSIRTAMNAISVLLLRDGADVVFIAPPSISEVILLFAICNTPSFLIQISTYQICTILKSNKLRSTHQFPKIKYYRELYKYNLTDMIFEPLCPILLKALNQVQIQ